MVSCVYDFYVCDVSRRSRGVEGHGPDKSVEVKDVPIRVGTVVVLTKKRKLMEEREETFPEKSKPETESSSSKSFVGTFRKHQVGSGTEIEES